YDEGMYPSGSANGKVVEANPQYASRGLELREHACGDISEPVRVPLDLSEGEQLVSAQAVFKTADNEVDLSQTIILHVEQNSAYVEFLPPKLKCEQGYQKGDQRAAQHAAE